MWISGGFSNGEKKMTKDQSAQSEKTAQKIQKIYLSYEEYNEILKDLSEMLKKDQSFDSITGVYGIPRGGLPISVYLSHHLNLPFYLLRYDFKSKNEPSNRLLVVDDIVDSGNTMLNIISELALQKKKYIFCSLFYKPISAFRPDFFVKETKDWIVFPWELDKETPSKIHQEMYPGIFQ